MAHRHLQFCDRSSSPVLRSMHVGWEFHERWSVRFGAVQLYSLAKGWHRWRVGLSHDIIYCRWLNLELRAMTRYAAMMNRPPLSHRRKPMLECRWIVPRWNCQLTDLRVEFPRSNCPSSVTLDIEKRKERN